LAVKESFLSAELSKQLSAVLSRFKGMRVLLVGDVAADHYIYGSTSRISREAPVLILKYNNENVIPGQAGNTAANLASLGGRVAPVSVIGNDFRGRDLTNALRLAKVETGSLITARGLSTLTKTRILAGGHHTCRQQVIRIDDDERMTLNGKIHDQVIAQMKKQAPKSGAIVISDYGYGLVTDDVWQCALALKKKHGIPLVLDSRYSIPKRQGATIITPNEGEAVACCGLDIGSAYEITDIGRKLKKISGAENILVTRGNEGMTLFSGKQETHSIPIFGTDQCTDVTGAGDTVAAVLTLSLASGATPLQAAHLANVAGGLVVMKMGTATVSPAELRSALRAQA
jgi:D-glycero-beta-D-manno-heptose-7-phosphate kinase